MVIAYEDEGRNKRKTKKREMFKSHLMEQGLQLETEPRSVSLYQENISIMGGFPVVLLRTLRTRIQFS